MVLCIPKFAFVDNTICVARDAATRDVAVSPIAFIGAAIGKGNLASALGLTACEHSFINRSIWECRSAGATNFAIKPFASIFIPVREPVSALSMLFAVAELAFVDATVIILFCLCLRVCGPGQSDAHTYRDCNCCALWPSEHHLGSPSRIFGFVEGNLTSLIRTMIN